MRSASPADLNESGDAFESEMEKLKFEVEKRDDTGKRARKALRSAGYIPATLYGKDLESLSLQVSGERLAGLLKDHGATNLLLELSVTGDKRRHPMVLIRQMQRHPITRRVLSIDFHRVSMDHAIHTSVPLAFVGDPVGVREGGILEHTRDDVEVSCLPQDIPEAIEVDISGLAVNEHISVSQIALPAGVEMATRSDEMIVAVRPKPIRLEEEVVEEVEKAEAAEAEGLPEAAGEEVRSDS
jgi:large subunit ribosomal protein L25